MSTQAVFVTAGATSKSVEVQLTQKASATSPGDPLTGLAYNTASLICYSSTPTTAPSAVGLVTQTNTGAFSSGGFVEKSSTNAPGLYRFDPPNAVIASAGYSSVTFTGAANLETHTVYFICFAVDIFGATSIKASQAAIGGYALPTGTALSGAASNIGLANGTTAVQCEPGDVIFLTGGTGAGQSAYVQSLAGAGGATPVATMVQAWITNPDNTSTYIILKVGGMVPSQPSDVWGVGTRTLTGPNNITANDTKIPIVAGRVDSNFGSADGSTLIPTGNPSDNSGVYTV